MRCIGTYIASFNNTMSILSKERDQVICREYESGLTIPQLASKFNLGKKYIRQILNANAIPRKKTRTVRDLPEYQVWASMKARCLNPNMTGYANYGGRGIKVSAAWNSSFEQFYADMGPRPSVNHSLERDDVNGNYETSNCRWILQKDQGKNRRNTVMIFAFGATKSIIDWSHDPRCVVSRQYLGDRIRSGMDPEKAITQRSRAHSPTPVRQKADNAERDESICRFYSNGLTLRDIGSRFNLSPPRIRQILDANGIRRRTSTNHTAKPEYRVWSTMKTRCSNTNCAEYALYGARGITVCARWLHSFENFYRDMGPKPSPRHSLERLDSDKGYMPSNCRWATPAEQNRNRRNTIWITAFGERKCCLDWTHDARCVVSATHLIERIRNGMNPEEAITKPSQLSHFKSTTHKQCTECGDIKPRSEFNINRPNANEPHKSKCKECQARLTHQRYVEVVGVKSKLYVGENERECGRCGAVKPNGEFYPMTSRNGAIKPYSRCIICCKEVHIEQKAKRAAKK